MAGSAVMAEVEGGAEKEAEVEEEVEVRKRWKLIQCQNRFLTEIF